MGRQAQIGLEPNAGDFRLIDRRALDALLAMRERSRFLWVMTLGTGFPHEIVDLFDSPRDWSEQSFLLTFVFGFGAVWLLAGAGALYQVRVANYFLWFYALGAGLINAISHFVFPILEGGYFQASTPRAGTSSSAPC